MQLLDAIIAFALTLAALATVVTVLMEAGLRIARMRKKNFIEVMKLLNKELDQGTLDLTPEERWDFFVKVVRNPAEVPPDILTVNGSQLLQKSGTNRAKLAEVEGAIAKFGRDKAAGANPLQQFGRFIKQLFRGDKNRVALYENVSLEYMLRCLAEIESVKQAAKDARYRLSVEFNRIARKYEELGSSVSASFKRHSQWWSIAIGILLAFFANIDGLRIFEVYRVDPELTKQVIEKHEDFMVKNEEARESLNTFNKLAEDVKKIQLELASKQSELEQTLNLYKKASGKDKEKIKAGIDTLRPEILKTEQALSEKETALEKNLSVNNIQQTYQKAQQQMADLVALGVPLGWNLYPSCPYGGTIAEWGQSSPKCKAIPFNKRHKKIEIDWYHARALNTAGNDPGGFLLWGILVIITGILIGLGAPFWFDVAKRLSAIRKGLQSAAASTEYRLSAQNANGDPEERNKIVNDVLEQAAA